MIIRGGCLCGAVAYEVRLPIAKFCELLLLSLPQGHGKHLFGELLCFTRGVQMDRR